MKLSFFKSSIFSGSLDFSFFVLPLNKLNIALDYSSKFNITWIEEDKEELLSKSSTPYNLLISSKKGDSDGDLTIINFDQ